MIDESGLQRRFFIYVLGPNQDSRLNLIAAATTGNPTIVTGIPLQLDSDAPFVLTGRCVCAKLTGGGGTVAGAYSLANLQTTWTGPNRDYRHSGGSSATRSYLSESLQSAFFGQDGLPKPITPGMYYPPGSVLMLDLKNISVTHAVQNLRFFWWGYKLYPKGAFPSFTYPKRCASQSFEYPVFQASMAAAETRLNQIFTVKQDADFVLRGGQGSRRFVTLNPLTDPFTEVSLVLKDSNKMAYSSDWVPLYVLFGGGNYLANIPIGPVAQLQTTYALGSGPSAPGLIYPEVYIPKNQQLLYDIQRNDLTIGANPTQDVTFNLVGSKVFTR